MDHWRWGRSASGWMDASHDEEMDAACWKIVEVVYLAQQ